MVSLRIALAATLAGLPLAFAAQIQPASAQQASAPQPGKQDMGGDASAPLLHLDVRRVPLDVVVTDKQGNPVVGLWKDDFVVK